MTKQEIEKAISFKKELIMEKLNQKHKIIKILSEYEEDLFELQNLLKECINLNLDKELSHE